GAVTFADSGSPSTAASFATTGVYVLRLTGSDSEFSRTSDVTITVIPGNLAPSVDAGPDLSVQLPATATLSGVATDDGLPAGTPLAMSWGKVSGPGTVTFTPPGAASTVVSFSAGGTYILRLTASDSQYTVHSYVTVIAITSIATPPPSLSIATPAEGAIITSI